MLDETLLSRATAASLNHKCPTGCPPYRDRWRAGFEAIKAELYQQWVTEYLKNLPKQDWSISKELSDQIWGISEQSN